MAVPCYCLMQNSKAHKILGIPHISVFIYDRTDEGISNNIYNDENEVHCCYGNTR